MGGLEQITNNIIKKAQDEADRIIKDAKIRADEHLEKSIKYRKKLREENDKNIEEERQRLINKSIAEEKKAVKDCELTWRNKIIDEIIMSTAIKIKNMDKQEYQNLLETLFNRLPEGFVGKIYFSQHDKNRINKDFIKKCIGKNKNIVIAESYTTHISSGFIVKGDKIDINCSIEALLTGKKSELCDYINSLIHF